MRFGLIAALLWPVASAQTLTDSATVTAILNRLQASTADQRLECAVEPIRPTLNFGFRIHAGYALRVPLAQFSGPGHSLTILTRIASGASQPPVFLMDTLRLPAVPRTDFVGEVGGGFFVGEGHYRVSWMLLDDRGRTCHKDWQLDAELGRGDRAVKLVMPPNTVTDVSLRASPAADRHPDAVAPMRITVLLDAAPRSTGDSMQSALSSSDQVFLLGTLSALLERVPATSVRLVAFNLEQQKELFRRDGFTLDSLVELAGLLNQLQLAKVDVQVLQSPIGYLDLLARLINQELRAQPASDTVIFLGPRERFHEKLPADALNKISGAAPRFFFLPFQAPRALSNSQDPRVLRDPMGGGRGGGRGGAGPMGQVSVHSAPDIMSGPELVGDYGGNIAIGTAFPDSPEGSPDTISLAVARLKGNTIAIQSPGEFAKAIQQIERRPSH